MERKAKEAGIGFASYDIDEPQEAPRADEIVREHGDWSEDYLIPQVFLESEDGRIRHVLTGYSESVDLTKRAVESLLRSPYFTGDAPVE